MKGKGVVDNLFILRGIINHANYLGKELWLTFYDIEKCFNSLWLEDCIDSLWDFGVKDDVLCFIYLILMNINATLLKRVSWSNTKKCVGDRGPYSQTRFVGSTPVNGLLE